MRISFPVVFLILCCPHPQARAQAPGAAIDIQHYGFSLALNDADNNIRGTAEVTLLFLKDATSFSLDLVKKNKSGTGMLVSAVHEGGKDLRFQQDSEKLTTWLPASAPAKKTSLHTYTIRYEGIPADGLVIG